MKTIITRTAIVVLIITGLVTLFACNKDKEAPKPTYVQLQTGLQKIDETYKIDGVTKIIYAVPNRTPETQINIAVGDGQLMGQQQYAYGTQTCTITLSLSKQYAKFTSGTCTEVEIITIE